MKYHKRKFATEDELRLAISKAVEKAFASNPERSERVLKRWAKNSPVPKIEFKFSPDFRSIVFRDVPYTLTLKQSVVVENLWKARNNRTPEISKASLLESAEIESKRLKNIFTGVNRILLKTLIESGSKKGTYRLNLSEHFK